MTTEDWDSFSTIVSPSSDEDWDAVAPRKRTQSVAGSAGRFAVRGFGNVVASVPVGVEIWKRSLEEFGRLGNIEMDENSRRKIDGLRRQAQTWADAYDKGAMSEDDFNTAMLRVETGIEQSRNDVARMRNPFAAVEKDTSLLSETQAYANSKAVREWFSNTFGDPDRADEGKFWAQLAEGAGSMAGFVTAGVVTGGSAAGVMALGSAVSAAGLYQDAIANGASEEDAMLAARLGALVGTTEAIPIERMLRILPGGRNIKQAFLRRVFESAATEGIQEGGMGIMENLIAQGIYDPERGTWDDVPEQFLIGAILGAGTSAALSPFVGREADPLDPKRPGALPTGAPVGPAGSTALGGGGAGSAPAAPPLAGPTSADFDLVADAAEVGAVGTSLETGTPAPQAEAAPGIPEGSDILLAMGETPESINAMNPTERDLVIEDALGLGVEPLSPAETAKRMGEAEAARAEAERPDSPRLSDGDRASPIPNDVIDDGKAAMETALDAVTPEAAEADAALVSTQRAEEVRDKLRAKLRPGTGAPREDRLLKAPVVDWMKKVGGIDPEGAAGQELINNGVTQKRFPGLFRPGGLKDVDNIDASDPFFSEIIKSIPQDQPGGGYFDRQDIIDAIVEEAGGKPRRTVRQMEIEKRQQEMREEYEFEPTPAPVDEDEGAAAPWIPAPEFELGTPGERRANVEAMVDGYLGELGWDTAFSASERTQIVEGLTETGGSVEDAIDWWMLQEADYVRNEDPTEWEPIPFPAPGEDLADAPRGDGVAGQDTGAEGEGAPVGAEAGTPAGARTGTEEGGAVDLTPEGEQLVIPGAEQITDKERGEREMDKPLRGKTGTMPEGGLFDEGARDQADMFDEVSTVKGKAEAAAERVYPKKYGFYRDNPGGSWLKEKQELTETRAMGAAEASMMGRMTTGSETASLGKKGGEDLFLPVQELSKLTPHNNEKRAPGDPTYDALRADVDRDGWDHDQDGNRIVVTINHKGQAFLMEGNTRLAIAKEEGVSALKAEVRYMNGGEDADGPMAPQKVADMGTERPAEVEKPRRPKSTAPKGADTAQPTDTGITAERTLLEDRLTKSDTRTMAKFRDSDTGEAFATLDEIWRRNIRMMNTEAGVTLAEMDEAIAEGADAADDLGVGGYAQMAERITTQARALLEAARKKKDGNAEGDDAVAREVQSSRDLVEEFEAFGYPPLDADGELDFYDRPDEFDPDQPVEDMPADQIFPKPGSKIKSFPLARSMKKGDFISPEEAAERLAEWKAEAKRQAESGENANKVIISLYDYTGAWSQPFVDAGYRVVRYDVKTGDDIMFSDVEARVKEFRQSGAEIVGVISACPCTTFTGAGARWRKDLHDKEDPAALRKVFGEFAEASGAKSAKEFNVMLAQRTKDIIAAAAPTGFHVLENPIGRIAKEADLPSPTLTFDPFQFGDPYTKRTQLWGDFATSLPTAPVDPVEGSKIQSKLRGTDPAQKEQRSITPEGFSYAFFMANSRVASDAEIAGRRDMEKIEAAGFEWVEGSMSEYAREKNGETQIIQPVKEQIGGREYFVLMDGDRNQIFQGKDVDKLIESADGAASAGFSGRVAAATGAARSAGLPLGQYGSPDQPLRFASGMNRAKDFRAALEEGVSIGIQVGEISNAAAIVLGEQIAKSTGSVFVDSGAFTVFMANQRAKEAGQPPLFEGTDAELGDKPLDFDQILRRYDRIVEVAAKASKDGGNDTTGRMFFAMPDIVGDQAGSLDLVKKYSSRINEDDYIGATPIVPLQGGRLKLTRAYEAMMENLGRNPRQDLSPVIGIPSQAAALSDQEFKTLLITYGDKISGIHILGSVSPARLQARIAAMKEAGWDGDVSADGNRLRSFLSSSEDRAEAMRRMIEDMRPAKPKKRTTMTPQIFGRFAIRQDKETFEYILEDLDANTEAGRFPTMADAMSRMKEINEAAKAPGGATKAVTPSENRLVTDDRAAEIRAKLKKKLGGGTLNAGIDPEILTLGAELAVYHIEKGARTFSAMVRAVAADLDMAPADLRRYARSWYNGARDMMEDSDVSVEGMDDGDAVRAQMETVFAQGSETVAAPETDAADVADVADVAGTPDSAATGFYRHFSEGGGFKTIVEARKWAKDMGYDLDNKQLEEVIEQAVIKTASDLARSGSTPQAIYNDLVDLYARQPRLSERTSTSVEQQAYSTPAPLAFIAANQIGLTANSHQSVYEPTAGNGMLLITARNNQNNTIVANELNRDRAARLRQFLGNKGEVMVQDATEPDLPGRKVSRVIANPPFGAVFSDEAGRQRVTWNVDGLQTKQVDHAIVMQSLSEMRSNGRAVFIIGGKQGTDQERAMKYRAEGTRQFMNKLYGEWNVVDHFTVDGKLYERQGAGFPVDVIVIEGAGKSALDKPMKTAPRLYKSWAELQEKLTDDRMDTSRPDGSSDVQGAVAGEGDAADVPGGAVAQDRPDGEAGRPATGDRAPASSGEGRPGSGRTPGTRGDASGGGQRGASGGGAVSSIRDLFDQDQARPGSTGADGGGDAGGVPARPVRKPVKRINTEAESALQVQYEPVSAAKFAVGTLVPRNMLTAMRRALADLSERVGDIDDYVARELGYTRDEILGTETEDGYFSAEQVDALALAISNVEKGAGFIIGDQTGVGKGRFVAAMLRYAARKGRVPVFITQNPGLYGDMIRDLRDVGMEKGNIKLRDRVLVTNNGLRGEKAIPLNPMDPTDTLTSATAAKQKSIIRKIAAGEGFPEQDFDMIFTTYSQLQYKPGGVEETDRQKALKMISDNAMFVLDESHEAGGVKKSDREVKKDGAIKKTRADFVREVIKDAAGVVYSSATYAKNPAVMDLYFKTDLGIAVEDLSKLGETLERGGVPMQQVAANMLVQSSQYARRERSYEGVEFGEKEYETDRETAVTAASALEKIFQADKEFMTAAREGFTNDMEGNGLKGLLDNAVGEVSADSTGFANIMHNIVSQMLLSLKVKSVAEDAIRLHKSGVKPVIAVSNTNGAILREHVEAEGLSEGMDADVPFNIILKRYLSRIRRITLKDEAEKTIRVTMTDADIVKYGGQHTLDAYKAVERYIDDLDLSELPGSPIDYLRDTLSAAGIKTDEITGRSLMISNGKLRGRKASPASKKEVMGRFNIGTLDALIINKSGATGFSLHATGKEDNDGKKRHMIVLQPDPNIDVFMQMLGRIHRTGQIEYPSYTLGSSDLAVERRQSAVLMRKMNMLSASTTASKKSSVSVEAVDFINRYGDEVVADVLREDVELQQAVGIQPRAKDNAGLASKVTGRLAILHPDRVAEIYETIVSAYKDYIANLDAMGMNMLEAKTLDLRAKTKSAAEITANKGGSSPFAAASQMEVVEARVLGKPHTPEKVRELIAEQQEKNPPGAAKETLRGLVPALMSKMEASKAAAEARLEAAKTQKQEEVANADISNWSAAISGAAARVAEVESVIEDYKPGQPIILTVSQGENSAQVYGMTLGVDVSKVSKSPLQLSKMSLRVAVADPSREVRIPLSKLLDPEGEFSITPLRSEAAVYKRFEEGGQAKTEERQIVTGNLIAGFEQVKKGSIVIFTDDKGQTREGILMPRDFDLAKSLDKNAVVFEKPAQVARFLREGSNRQVKSEDGVMMMSISSMGDLAISVKRKGGKQYYLLRAVRNITGEFQSRSGAFTGTAPIASIDRVVEAYQDNLGTRFVTDTHKDEARAITGKKPPEFKDKAMAPEGWGAVEPTINFAERVKPKDMAELRAELDALGLNDVALDLEADIGKARAALGRAEGQTKDAGDGAAAAAVYRGKPLSPGQIIIMQAVNPAGALAHEAIHAARNLGLFTKKEWSILQRRAAAAWVKKFNIVERYPEGNVDLWTEEAIAEMAREKRNRTSPGESKEVRGLLQRVANFFEAVGNWMRGNGFQSADDVLDSFFSGEVGRRERQASGQGRETVRQMRPGRRRPLDDGAEAPDFEAIRHAGAHEVARSFLVWRNWPELAQKQTWADAYHVLRRNFADRMNALRRQQAAIERGTGRPLPLTMDAYTMESLYYGRTGERVRDFYNKEVQPFMEKMRAAGISQRQIEDYLIARHVPERNKKMAELRMVEDPDHQFAEAARDDSVVGGSGFSNAWAAAKKAEAESGPKAAAYRELAEAWDAIMTAKLDNDVAMGLTSAEAAEAMSAAYKYYVPLKGWEVDPEDQTGGIGRGFDIRGKESERATGRTTRADSPLAYGFSARANGIIRGEKNRVGRAFLRMVQSNPNPEAWSVNRPERKTKIEQKAAFFFDPETGLPEIIPYEQAKSYNAPPSRIADNVMIVKEGGKEVFITIENPDLAAAMKNLGSENLDVLTQVMGKAIRLMSALNTTWNAEWFSVNIARDLQTAGIQISDEGIKGLGMQMFENWAPAMKGAFEYLSGKEEASEWAKVAKDFALNGGKVDYIEFNDIRDMKEMIQGELTQSKAERILKAGPKKMFNAVQILTGAGENAIRIAAYKAAVDAGLPKAKAASIARELTVNFNRKGTMGPTVNALYMFFNAAVQGNVRLMQSVYRSKFTRKVLVGLVGIGILETLLGLGDEDEYEAVDDWVRERNFVIMLAPLGLGDKGEYVKIAMPYGYNVFKTLGTEIGRTMFHGTEPSTAASNVVSAAMNSFNPIGGNDFLSMLMPTIFDPFLDIARNQNFFGSTIYPEYTGDRRPDSEKYYPSVGETSKAFTAWLNRRSFLWLTEPGNEFKSGFMSISPENVDHVITSYLGGAGRLASNVERTAADLLMGRSPEPERAPFIRQIYGRTISEMPTWRAYDMISDGIRDLEFEIKGLREAGDREGARNAIERDPVATKLMGRFLAYDSRLRGLRKTEKRIRAARGMDEAKREELLEKIRGRQYDLQRRAVEQWQAARKEARSK